MRTLSFNRSHYFLTPASAPLGRTSKFYFHSLSDRNSHSGKGDRRRHHNYTYGDPIFCKKANFCTASAGQNNRLKAREQASNGPWWVRITEVSPVLPSFLTESFTRDQQPVP